MASTLILSSLLSLVLAQTTTLTIPAIGYDESSFLASVVSVNSAATTISIACAPTQECGLFPHHTIVYGASTYNVDMSDPNSDFTATQDCVIAATQAVCKESAGGSEANFPGSSTETYEASDIGSLTVVVTKGAEKLTASAQATTSAGSSGSSSSSGSASGSGASRSTASVVQATSSNSASRSVSASGTGSPAAATSTAAAAANALAFGGGVAGVVAGVLGLFL